MVFTWSRINFTFIVILIRVVGNSLPLACLAKPFKKQTKQALQIKGLVHPKMKIILLFILYLLLGWTNPLIKEHTLYRSYLSLMVFLLYYYTFNKIFALVKTVFMHFWPEFILHFLTSKHHQHVVSRALRKSGSFVKQLVELICFSHHHWKPLL